MKKHGFTLAETLITLIIIGVVAALTVPNMLQQYKKQETSARLKKFYSTIQQASVKAKADGKDWNDYVEKLQDGISYDPLLFWENYLLPYTSIIKYENKNKNLTVYLNDGSLYNLKIFSKCLWFDYDVNGDKKPNEFGRDIYQFMYCSSDAGWYKSNIFIPKQIGRTPSRAVAYQDCQRVNASYCAFLVMMDGWEFKDDYPYRL